MYHFMSPSSTIYEFDEADIWNTTTCTAAVVFSSSSPDRDFSHLAVPSSSGEKKKVEKKKKKNTKSMGSPSLPVKIPQDWSRILKVHYEGSAEEEVWFPPHVFLERQRALFPVHDGTGKTFRGRDLSIRVRDAIWKHTGFED